MKKLKYLVTGTGRCGTVYMARLLTSLGIPCGHESIFDWHGCHHAEMRLKGDEPIKCSKASLYRLSNGKWFAEPNWVNTDDIVAESSYMAAPFLDKSILCDVPVIHIVRDPVNVINSFSNYLGYFKSGESANEYEQFIYGHLPELQKKMTPYDRAALFYVLWNEFVDVKETFFHRIEDDVNQVLDFLGVQGSHYDNTSINTHRKPGKRFVFSNIQSSEVAQRLAAKCEEYGYRQLNAILL